MAGLTGPDQQLPAPVRVKRGVNNAGRTMRYYLNYSAAEQTFQYPYKSGTELISGDRIARNAMVTLAPWDLAIIEEGE